MGGGRVVWVVNVSERRSVLLVYALLHAMQDYAEAQKRHVTCCSRVISNSLQPMFTITIYGSNRKIVWKRTCLIKSQKNFSM